jgi:hypothetical protein
MDILLHLLLFGYLVPLAISVVCIDIFIQSSNDFEEIQSLLSKRYICYMPIYNIILSIAVIRHIINQITNTNDNV